MSSGADQGERIRSAVEAAFRDGTPLRIAAGGSKAFLGEPILGEPATAGEPLDVTGHRGIVKYEPGELVVTVRAGTPLTELQAELAEQRQMLAFEPPHFGAGATVGGTIAAGLSGPARPYTGAARDFVLGSRVVNGRGEALRLGGDVMKNVAGYDLSRLMAGAYGTLSVLLDVSLKVLPVPRAQITLVHEHDAGAAIRQFNAWARKPWPITAAYWENGRSYLRLAGADAAVQAAREVLGGETLEDDGRFWTDVREQRRDFFTGERPLWRLSLPPAAPPLAIEGDSVVDWGGAQRWLRSEAKPAAIRRAVANAGGHASVYRGDATLRFHPLPDALMALHRRIKQSLDPAGILNPGRLYPGL